MLNGHPPSWVDFVNTMVDGGRVPNDEEVIVKNPMYLKKLSGVLKSTNNRTISNYLMWRAVKSKITDLNLEIGR